MLEKITKRWNEQYKRLIPPTRSCKICFKNINNKDICHIVNSKIDICSDCLVEMEPKFIRFKVEVYNAVAIYEYNQFIRKLIYQFKGCYDYVLGDVFLECYYRELKLRYYDYYIIPIPSYENDDEERGFNHVVETFKRIGNQTLNILKKIEKHKQATSNLKQRREVYKSLAIKSNIDLTNKKVLIVDDVYTTGSTMKSAINLIERLNPKTIKVLVIAKTKHKQRTNTN